MSCGPGTIIHIPADVEHEVWYREDCRYCEMFSAPRLDLFPAAARNPYGVQAQGAAGWGWQGVLPYFKRLERHLDRIAVVDPLCRVIGVEGLRVVDGSVMPALVCANTNIPIITIAEKAADIIEASVR